MTETEKKEMIKGRIKKVEETVEEIKMEEL
jgi:hypothetical protein